jgi:hypothetical protein
MCGELVADAILGRPHRHPILELFDPGRLVRPVPAASATQA